jgi:hypothetical protein
MDSCVEPGGEASLNAGSYMLQLPVMSKAATTLVDREADLAEQDQLGEEPCRKQDRHRLIDRPFVLRLQGTADPVAYLTQLLGPLLLVANNFRHQVAGFVEQGTNSEGIGLAVGMGDRGRRLRLPGPPIRPYGCTVQPLACRAGRSRTMGPISPPEHR